jgi:adenosylcobyric acid synthase
LGRVFAERTRLALPTLGVCGGYQMLGERIVDGIESEEGQVSGLGLLPVGTVFERDKLLGRPSGRAPLFGDAEVSGYEIRHGRVFRHGGEPLFVGDGLAEGCKVGATLGTSWHGVMESDGFRRSLLDWVARRRGLDWAPGEEAFAAARERRLEKLGDVVAENVEREVLLRLIEDGPPPGLPVIRLQASGFGHQQGAADYGAFAKKKAMSANGEAPTAEQLASDGANGIQDLKAET